jgi:hypothetical protein
MLLLPFVLNHCAFAGAGLQFRNKDSNMGTWLTALVGVLNTKHIFRTG